MAAAGDPTLCFRAWTATFRLRVGSAALELGLRVYGREVCRAYGEMVSAVGKELGRLDVLVLGMRSLRCPR